MAFDPNTMMLPEFLEEHNQRAEKTFGRNCSGDDGYLTVPLIATKGIPQKHSVKMARLENATYDDIAWY